MTRCERMRQWLADVVGEQPLRKLTDTDNEALAAFAHLAVLWDLGGENNAVVGMAACVAAIKLPLRYVAIVGLAGLTDWPAIGKLGPRLVPPTDMVTPRLVVQELTRLDKMAAAGVSRRFVTRLEPAAAGEVRS